MEGTFIDVLHIDCTLSEVEVLQGEISLESESHYIEDSNGNILVDSDGNLLADYHLGSKIEGILSDVYNLSADLSIIDEIVGNLSALEGVSADITLPTSIGGMPYTGDYEVTPSSEVQILNTQGKSMRQNVTINPIPSNYGLITWNGGFLTVS